MKLLLYIFQKHLIIFFKFKRMANKAEAFNLLMTKSSMHKTVTRIALKAEYYLVRRTEVMGNEQ